MNSAGVSGREYSGNNDFQFDAYFKLSGSKRLVKVIWYKMKDNVVQVTTKAS